MRRIDIAERRARLARRHHLARPAGEVEDVAGDLVGLHSSDPATPYLAARARLSGFRVEQLEDALYQRRSLVRMLGMRRTMFVVPLDLAAVMREACARSYLASERRRLIGMIEDQQLAGDGASWLAALERATLDALTARGEATASQLTEYVPELALRLSFGAGRKWGGTMGMSTRILFLLATAGRVLRARPQGSWRSSQYRWALAEHWLGTPLEEISAEEARPRLARRWLRSYGPGTVRDLKWWSGWTVSATRAALEELEAVEVELDGSTGFLLPDDLEPVSSPDPWVALLPGLDPTVMGWKERDWYLGDHGSQVFDRNGNAGPTVWWNGRIVGGWVQGSDGEVVVELLEDVGREARRVIEEEAAAVGAWLGETVVTVRFPAPLDRALKG